MNEQISLICYVRKMSKLQAQTESSAASSTQNEDCWGAGNIFFKNKRF